MSRRCTKPIQARIVPAAPSTTIAMSAGFGRDDDGPVVSSTGLLSGGAPPSIGDDVGKSGSSFHSGSGRGADSSVDPVPSTTGGEVGVMSPGETVAVKFCPADSKRVSSVGAAVR